MEAAKNMPGAMCSGKTVLVIDDHPAARETLGDVLGMSGYRVVTAPDGERGIALADELLPDVILTDLRMPGANGMEVLRRIRSRARTAGIPVIVMTFEPAPGLKERCLRAGASAFVAKETGATQLVEAITQIVRETGPAFS